MGRAYGGKTISEVRFQKGHFAKEMLVRGPSVDSRTGKANKVVTKNDIWFWLMTEDH